MKEMKSYQCGVCGGEGTPLKPGYKANGESYTVLCTDHLIEFERPKHLPSTWLFGWPEYFLNYNSELFSFYWDSFRKWFVWKF
jgi:hypothetical protein